MRVRSYLTEATQDLGEIMPKLEYLKITNAGSYLKAEIKTQDGTFMNFSETKMKMLLKELYKRVKEY